MKRFVLPLFCIFLPFAAGCQSNEQKASALVKNYLSGVLNDFKSYESAAIQVEPLYNTADLDRDCIDAGKLMNAEEELQREYDSKAIEAQGDMNTWMFDMSSFGQSQYNSAARLYYENKISSIKASIRYWEQAKFIKEQSAKLNGKEQIGWIIAHNFRSNNELGLPELLSYTFLADKDFKSITAAYNNDDKKTKNAIMNINTIVEDETTPEGYDEMITSLQGTISTYEDLKSQLK